MKRTEVFDAAIEYMERGWCPVPIPFREKGPTLKGWQQLRIRDRAEIATHFKRSQQNIGIILGEPSGDLVDVDLDQPECLPFAEIFLTSTLSFGREGNPNSHWLYEAPTKGTKVTFLVVVPNPAGGKDRITFAELRANQHQTRFPPSVDQNGESVVWSNDLPVTVASFDELKILTGRIAAGAVLAQAWPRQKGCRHDCEMALAGILIRCGMPDVDAERFIYVVATIAGTENAASRARNVIATTRQRFALNQPFTGWHTLSTILNKPELTSKVPEWLGYSDFIEESRSSPLAQSTDQQGELDVTAARPLANLNNAVKILERDAEFHDLVWFDEFKQRILTGPSPREWTEADDIHLTLRFQRDKGIPKMSQDTIGQAITEVAFGNKKNCVRDWLETCNWDGEPRIDHFFEDYYGTEGSMYTRAASRNFLISMVARIYKPGCQVDTMPVLEGPQGIFKSSSLRVLAGEHHSEQHEAVTSKDFFQNLQGKWLIEISEMDSFSRNDTSKVKQVISCPTDRFRPSYGRRALDHPRQCIFVGTTNRDDWNKDETGARRFLPIACKEIDIKGIAVNREQLFGEAVHRFKSGETWWMMPADETRRQQALRYDPPAWCESIRRYMDHEPLNCGDRSEWIRRPQPLREVSVAEVLQFALNIPEAQWTKHAEMRVAEALRFLQWTRKTVRREGKPQKLWLLPPEVVTDEEGGNT